jgi:dTMP kinase
MTRGLLITIEGLDGAGKSTLAAKLSEELARRQVAVESLREPGGVPVSERIRELVQDPALDVCPRTEALLYAAARAQLLEQRLRPALAQGKLVLLDRFLDSSLAYQGAGRGLGVEQVREINLFATGGLIPDRTLLLSVSPEAGRKRQHGRGAEADRLEREDGAFFAKVAAAYEQLSRQEPERIRTIDAERPPAAVLADALAALSDLINPPV